MDSRLLNVVYDDPFDGNYAKYDGATEFWSSSSETMGMQLAETLNGILPIAPTEDFHKDEHTSALVMQNNKNGLNYENFADQHLPTGGGIEIVTVDPYADGYDTDSENEEDSDGDDNDNDKNDLLDFERQSQCSNGTFRTRTDSSSIGDYESHTSDYDDENDNNEENNIGGNMINQNNIFFPNIHTNLVASDNLLFDSTFHKNRTLSTNTLNSDIDALGLQIDANNFDLAEFITEDDFKLQHIPLEGNRQSHADVKVNALPNDDFDTNIAQTSTSVVRVMSSKYNDTDSDSDVIVDVETVEIDDINSFGKATEIFKSSTYANARSTPAQPQVEEDMSYVDNAKSDPSWSPKHTMKKMDTYKVEEKSKPNFTRNFPLVPNKKQCDLLKGKFAKGKGKVLQKPIKILAAKNINIENPPAKETPTISSTSSCTIKPEDSLKNIDIAFSSVSQESSVKTTEKQQQKPDSFKREAPETPAHKAQAVKRKLNLEEYKKRRRGDPTDTVPNKIPTLDNRKISNQNNDEKKATVNTIPTVKHSEAVISIVKTLKEQQNVAPKIDPITEAKNKVLRMQELKRAQQMRIIDSTISAKVPRVTKLLPLREIVKDTPYLNEKENKSFGNQAVKSDYEELIIMSVSCNTEISIPPFPNQIIQPINNASRSLLKSSVLLSTITNSFQKVKAIDSTKISTSCLIASIQDVVVKKTLPIEHEIVGDFKGDFKGSNKPEHHGEDKIIMHLRKDRVRKRMCTIGIQTDLQPEFPPLPLPKTSMQHKLRERTGRHRKRQYRKRNQESSASSSSEYSSDEHSDNSNSSTISHSRDNSCSSSLERMRTYDSAIGTGGYSSRSSRKHRSSISSSYSESVGRVAHGRRQRRTSYSKRSAARKRSRSPYSSSSCTSDSDRSRSPFYRRSRSRSDSRTRSRSRRSSYRQSVNNNFVDRNISQHAVEERRIVYVGRIEQETTKDILRRKFLQYGTIKHISIHYKDTGMKYGFVTFERSQDAFAAIDNSNHDPQINMYDVSFGGRRAFCRASYADLDNAGINTYHSYVFPQPAPQPKEEDSFEALLMKMKAKLNANKTNTSISNVAADDSDTKATNSVAGNVRNAANNQI